MWLNTFSPITQEGIKYKGNIFFLYLPLDHLLKESQHEKFGVFLLVTIILNYIYPLFHFKKLSNHFL